MISAPNQLNAFVDGKGILTRYGLTLLAALVKRSGGADFQSGDGNLGSGIDSLETRLVEVAQAVTPTSGSVVQMVDNAQNGFLRIKGVGTLTSLAIAHPTNGVDAQVRVVYFERAVTAITWPNSSAINLPSSAVAGDSVTTQRLEAGLWTRRT